MPDLGAIATAAASLKTAGEIVKGLIGLRDTAMVQSKVIELQTVILSAQSSALDAQSEHFALLERIRGLEAQIAGMESWEVEKQRYQLTELVPGTACYIVKEGVRGSEPRHAICSNCYEDGKKSILHIMTDYLGSTHLTCPRCKTKTNCYIGEGEFPPALGPGQPNPDE